MLTALIALPVHANDEYAQAVQRWRAGGIRNYRIAVLMEYRGQRCYQELEVHDGGEPSMVHDTCPLSWLGNFTVPRLFDLAGQLADIPVSRCYPSAHNCICQRTFSTRQIGFDERYGYPIMLATRSDLHYSWDHIEFWAQLLRTYDLPSCTPSPRTLLIEIVSLTPLPSR
jgi:hypothetical protein